MLVDQSLQPVANLTLLYIVPQICAVEVETGCTTQVLKVQVEVAAASAMTCTGAVLEI